MNPITIAKMMSSFIQIGAAAEAMPRSNHENTINNKARKSSA